MASSGEVGRFAKARRIFRQHGGLLRTKQAIQAGIHPRTLYQMRDEGVVERLARGLYRLTELEPLGSPDLVSVSLKVPAGVICLISALAYHEITTQIPHAVYVALPRGAEPPRLEYPPTRIFWFTGKSYSEGIETHRMDRAEVRIYSPEKTLADCFKYRNKIGLDTALEALKLYRQRKRIKINEILKYASICRIENVIRPYLEAIS